MKLLSGFTSIFKGLFKNIFKGVSGFFTGGFWSTIFSFLGKYSTLFTVVLLLAFGIHYKNVRTERDELKATEIRLNGNINDLTKDLRLANDQIAAEQAKNATWEALNKKTIEDYQKLIKDLQNKHKTEIAKHVKEADEMLNYISDLESGVLCKRVNVFGKVVRIEKCE